VPQAAARDHAPRGAPAADALSRLRLATPRPQRAAVPPHRGHSRDAPRGDRAQHPAALVPEVPEARPATGARRPAGRDVWPPPHRAHRVAPLRPRHDALADSGGPPSTICTSASAKAVWWTPGSGSRPS
jgi:hypothetical protein